MTDPTAAAVRDAALWFEPEMEGFGPLLERVRNARVALLNEASHGTREFYHARAELTKALIARHGFNIVAVEADWPDAQRGLTGGTPCTAALPQPNPSSFPSAPHISKATSRCRTGPRAW